MDEHQPRLHDPPASPCPGASGRNVQISNSLADSTPCGTGSDSPKDESMRRSSVGRWRPGRKRLAVRSDERYHHRDEDSFCQQIGGPVRARCVLMLTETANRDSRLSL